MSGLRRGTAGVWAIAATVVIVLSSSVAAWAAGPALSAPAGPGTGATLVHEAGVPTAGNVTIYPNGTSSNPTIVNVTGTTATILESFDGNITDFFANSVLDGNGTTVNVSANASDVASISLLASGITLENVTTVSTGYTVSVYGDSFPQSGVFVNANETGIVVRDSTVITTGAQGSFTFGIWAGNFVPNNTTQVGGGFVIENNTVIGPGGSTNSTLAGSVGIVVAGTNVTISNNTVTNFSAVNGSKSTYDWWDGTQSAALLVGCAPAELACAVENNSLQNNTVGVIAALTNPGFGATYGTGPIWISYNTIGDNGAYGIFMEKAAAPVGNTIDYNTIDNLLTGANALFLMGQSYNVTNNVFIGTSTVGDLGPSQQLASGGPINTSTVEAADIVGPTVVRLDVNLFLDTPVYWSTTFTSPSSNISGGELVNFTETGLTDGTPWSLTLADPTGTVLAPNSIVADLDNSTIIPYHFTVGPVPGYSASPPSGNVTVDDAPVSQPIVFSPPLFASPSASVNPTQVGATTVLSAGASGGSGTYTSYVWSGLPLSCAAPGNVAAFNCTPSVPGNYTVRVNVTDSAAARASGTFTLVVAPAVSVSLVASYPQIDPGVASVLTLGVTGGVAPVTWTLTGNGSSSNLTGVVNGSYPFFSNTPGVYTFYLNATDAVGSTSKTTATVTVAPLTATLVPSANATQVGGSVTLTVGTTGGAAPVSWTVTRNGSSENLSGFVDGTYTFAPVGTGAYEFYLNATDAVGNTSTAQVRVTVVPKVAVSLSASAGRLDVGQRTNLTVGTTGGVIPVHWTLTENGSSANLSGVVGGIYNFRATAVGTYTFYLNATDAVGSVSNTTAAIVVSLALTAPSTPTVTATALDADQALTVTSTLSGTGSGPISWGWMVSVNTAPYVATTQCAKNSGSGAEAGATETCAVSASTLTAGDTYTFELQATDSATVPETASSAASAVVAVASALTAPHAPALTASALDVNQALTVTGTFTGTGTATISWQWMVSVNGGTSVAATQCAKNSGSGAEIGATETCAVSASTLTAGDTYAFALQVTDSAGTAESATSVASGLVAVASALTAPHTPTRTASALDVNQALTVTGTFAGTGTATISWQWVVSVNGGTSVAATQCAKNSGSGAEIGATETCAVSASTLTAGDTYTFELQATDSATAPETATSAASGPVAVSSALTVALPSVSSSTVTQGSTVYLAATTPTTGTSPYTYQWLEEAPGATGYLAAVNCAAPTTLACAFATTGSTPTGTYSFELQVTDHATTPTVVTSGPVTVTVKASATSIPLWEYALTGVVVLLVVLLLVWMVVRRRGRRRPSARSQAGRSTDQGRHDAPADSESAIYSEDQLDPGDLSPMEDLP